MSASASTARPDPEPPSSPAVRRRRRRGVSLVAVLVTTVVWTLLWDQITVLVVVSGVLLSLGIGLVFPLPPIELHGRFRPVALARLVITLMIDLVRSSVAVAVLAFRPGDAPRSAIIAVPLRSRSDLYLTQTAELVSLVPGSIVLEARRSTSTLYLHVLDAVSPEELDQARRDVLAAEARVVRALGSRAEIAAIDDGTPWPSQHDAHDTGTDLAAPEGTS